MPDSPQPRSGALALAGLAIGAALIYLAALFRFPLLAIYATPLQNLDKLTESNPLTGLLLAVCVLLLFAGYGWGARLLALERVPRRWLVLLVLLPPLVFAAILFFVYPTTSLDVYDYLFRGRMAVRYGVNNFVTVPSTFAASDPLLIPKPVRFVPWHNAVTAYGPLWEALSYGAAWLAGERRGQPPLTVDPTLRALMFAYKGLGALGFLACGAVVWGALGALAPQRRWLGLYLWLWNPLVLWESLAAAHNDAWMAMAIVGAVWAFAPAGGFRTTPLLFRRSLFSFLALTFGGLAKYFALVFGPLVLAASLRRLTGWRERLLLVLMGGAVCLGVVALAYLPFWEGAATLRNFNDRGVLFYATWLSSLQAGLVDTGLLTMAQSQRLVSSLASTLLMLGIFWSAWLGWSKPARLAEHALWLLLWFLLVANPWFQPWYILWAVALVAIQPQRGRMALAMGVFSLMAMLSYLAGSFLLPVLGWKSASAAWNILLSLVIYLPLLAVLLGNWRMELPSARTTEPGTAEL